MNSLVGVGKMTDKRRKARAGRWDYVVRKPPRERMPDNEREVPSDKGAYNAFYCEWTKGGGLVFPLVGR